MANTSKGSQPSVDSKVTSGMTVADDLDFARVVQIFFTYLAFHQAADPSPNHLCSVLSAGLYCDYLSWLRHHRAGE